MSKRVVIEISEDFALFCKACRDRPQHVIHDLIEQFIDEIDGPAEGWIKGGHLRPIEA